MKHITDNYKRKRGPLYVDPYYEPPLEKSKKPHGILVTTRVDRVCLSSIRPAGGQLRQPLVIILLRLVGQDCSSNLVANKDDVLNNLKTQMGNTLLPAT